MFRLSAQVPRERSSPKPGVSLVTDPQGGRRAGRRAHQLNFVQAPPAARHQGLEGGERQAADPSEQGPDQRHSGGKRSQPGRRWVACGAAPGRAL